MKVPNNLQRFLDNFDDNSYTLEMMGLVRDRDIDRNRDRDNDKSKEGICEKPLY